MFRAILNSDGGEFGVSDLPEMDGINVAECLEGAGGNQELVRRMIVRFRRENEGIVDRLRDTLGSGAWSQALEILQTLQARSRAIAARGSPPQLRPLRGPSGGPETGARRSPCWSWR